MALTIPQNAITVLPTIPQNEIRVTNEIPQDEIRVVPTPPEWHHLSHNGGRSGKLWLSLVQIAWVTHHGQRGFAIRLDNGLILFYGGSSYDDYEEIAYAPSSGTALHASPFFSAYSTVAEGDLFLAPIT